MLNESYDNIGPGFLDNAPGASAPDLPTNIQAIRSFVRACTAKPISEEEIEEALCFNMVVSPQVRRSLITRSIDSDEVLSNLTVPVLVTHGMEDSIVLPSMGRHVLDVCPTAKAS